MSESVPHTLTQSTCGSLRSNNKFEIYYVFQGKKLLNMRHVRATQCNRKSPIKTSRFARIIYKSLRDI